MSVGVFISHAARQAEQVMALVDLLEAGLRLPDDAIGCSSLPGYAVGRDARAAIESANAVIAWLDADAPHDGRMGYELGLAAGLGKWIVVVADAPVVSDALPWPLGETSVVLRTDQTALRALVEDVGFQLDLPPRLGADAAEAIARVSLAPPAPASAPPTRSAPPARAVSTPPMGVPSAPPPLRGPSTAPPRKVSAPPASRQSSPTIPRMSAPPSSPTIPRVSAPPVDEYESLDSVPPEAPAGSQLPTPVVPRPGRIPREATAVREDTQEVELGDVVVASASSALEAGRALSDCVFHRDEGGDVARELGDSFGRFIDSVGGEWQALARLGDLDVWVEAAENLLSALPSAQRALADWYGLGFEFALLLNLSALGVPDDPEGRADFIRTWQDSAARFRMFATTCLGDEAAARVHYRLDSLIGPEEDRDYSNVATTLGELRAHAAASA